MTSRYLLRESLPYSLRHHSTSRCNNCSKILYDVLRHSFCLASVPDASAVVADLAASVIAEIPAAIADIPAAVTFAVVSP
jgi:hypothetical protein